MVPTEIDVKAEVAVATERTTLQMKLFLAIGAIGILSMLVNYGLRSGGAANAEREPPVPQESEQYRKNLKARVTAPTKIKVKDGSQVLCKRRKR
ncbi:hypothetical protein [Hymenobacter jejuensis]|uniref:Uncharacterized protein n=1 Tax=Hymenobacter jejuensis TaxID=2502781 RepID=A0A5B8A3Z8_9BACT|nr:hypothetical protein [Hymenobacter jejuensis]QDA61957.1 hypothetical protein FHG12_18455 [Hymenobacter jejuensis]